MMETINAAAAPVCSSTQSVICCCVHQYAKVCFFFFSCDCILAGGQVLQRQRRAQLSARAPFAYLVNIRTTAAR